MSTKKTFIIRTKGCNGGGYQPHVVFIAINHTNTGFVAINHPSAAPLPAPVFSRPLPEPAPTTPTPAKPASLP